MNTLRKIYCRAFQKAFHIAIPFLPYRKPKIAGSVRELPEIIMRHKCTHVLIITDGGIMTLGLTRRLEKALKEAGIPYTIYDTQTVLLGLGGNGFTMQMFIAGAFATALPGIVLQLVLIPVVMVGLEHAGVLRDTV